ncbi:uncharacterized protein LOC120323439 isoform X4 [Pipra filicauda]|uniref:Uncharacterized protein LOC120323439 isoform X4 n=1 Tax=Pipra filicauda TaxID=649802 RepID=A0A7R5K966_9PASS|nr:uncharacterized protein LOC120323439 isoform X4 [Pipra filicauda]
MDVGTGLVLPNSFEFRKWSQLGQEQGEAILFLSFYFFLLFLFLPVVSVLSVGDTPPEREIKPTHRVKSQEAKRLPAVGGALPASPPRCPFVPGREGLRVLERGTGCGSGAGRRHRGEEPLRRREGERKCPCSSPVPLSCPGFRPLSNDVLRLNLLCSSFTPKAA